MTRATPAPDGVQLDMPLLDILVLNQQVIDLIEEVARDEPAADLDPLAALEAEWAGLDAAEDDEPDALSKRLFPNAYPDDPQASAEFRRYTEMDLRRAKVREGSVVTDALTGGLREIADGFSGTYERLLEQRGDREATILVPRGEIDAWLKTLTAVRLRLGVELELDTTEDLDELDRLPDDDPRAMAASIFDWVAYVQESMIQAM